VFSWQLGASFPEVNEKGGAGTLPSAALLCGSDVSITDYFTFHAPAVTVRQMRKHHGRPLARNPPENLAHFFNKIRLRPML
jgi:hypothetical protein